METLTIRQIIRPFWFIGALLMLADGLTTYYALKMFSDNGVREGNPIGVYAMNHIGIAGTCGLKVVIGVFCVWRLAVIAERGHKWKWMNYNLLGQRPLWKIQRSAIWALAFTVFVMGLVVGSNLRTIVALS